MHVFKKILFVFVLTVGKNNEDLVRQNAQNFIASSGAPTQPTSEVVPTGKSSQGSYCFVRDDGTTGPGYSHSPNIPRQIYMIVRICRADDSSVFVYDFFLNRRTIITPSLHQSINEAIIVNLNFPLIPY